MMAGHAGVFDLELCEHDEKANECLSDSDDMQDEGAEVSEVHALLSCTDAGAIALATPVGCAARTAGHNCFV